MDTERIRKDFPLVSEAIYLDSASTSLSPEPVLAAMLAFERHYRANVGRGVHRLCRRATEEYAAAHEKVARFIRGEGGVTVFTKNTTEAINAVARGLGFGAGDRVVTTILEHHSNLLPWMRLRERGVDLRIVGLREDYTPDLDALAEEVSRGARLVAITHASNVLGVITPVEEVARICKEAGALLLVDGSQSVPHLPVDARRLGADFLCFSGHKMLGPTGTGVLWMREPTIPPSDVGGGIVETVTEEGYTLAGGYARYEAGTPHIAGGIGLGAAVDYLERAGRDAAREHEERLATRLIGGLSRLPGVRVYAPPDPARRIGVVSFTVEGVHPHEVARRLDAEGNIMVRSGHHCCMPLMTRLGLRDGTVRASLYIYNTAGEVDALVEAVGRIAGRA
ncbi:MAG: cysteine desulfurase [Methanolinea sp.]|nr:cysteine desulfurase [Methanolinea sp.]